tara:strand:- start:766 stop:882 length:117 start_codon:yes stop_codon:yes gene_type:complete
MLDLDYLGAQSCHQLGGKWQSRHLLYGQDPDTVQWAVD